MTVVTPTNADFQPYLMKEVDLILGSVTDGTNFQIQVTSATLTPAADVQTIKTAAPGGSWSETAEASWTLDIGFAFGRNKTTAQAELGAYLSAHHGEKVPFLYRPIAGDEDYGWSGTVLLTAAPMGGQYNAYSEQTVSLPLDGQPEPLGA